MTDLKDYLREEIEEEARLGYLSAAESGRRMRLLDDSDATPVGPDAVLAGPDAGTPDDDDGTIRTFWSEIAGPVGPLRAYVARPIREGAAPGVVVVHENKGLVPYIRAVTRQLASAGFIALAPDLLTRAGGTHSFTDQADATAALGKIAPDDLVADLKAAVDFLTGHANGQVGALGFCFGGGMVWRLITQDRRLKAAIPFYGPNPPLDTVAAIETPVFAVYGGLDKRITSGLPDIEAAMASNGKTFERRVFDGAQHAFHNDTNPDRYHPEAAASAWRATVEHLTTWLGR